MPSGSEGGFVWFEAATAFAVVFTPVLFHSSEGDNRPNERENLTSERQKKETEGGGGAEVKAQQRLPLFLSFYIVSEGLSTNWEQESERVFQLGAPQPSSVSSENPE